MGKDLVIGEDARAEIGLKRGAGQAGGVAADQLAAVVASRHDVHHAVIAGQHPAHVHDLGQTAHFVPRQHLGNVSRVEVVAG